MLTAYQESAVCDELVAITPSENDLTLKAEGLRAIKVLLGCSDDRAQKILDDLCQHEAIRLEPAEQGDDTDSGKWARWRWQRGVRR
jgi:hypothetical protein